MVSCTVLNCDELGSASMIETLLLSKFAT